MFKKIKEKLVYRAKVVDVYEDYLEMPNGKEVVYDLIKHKGGACILPIDNDGNLILIKQYRNVLGEENIEVPAGAYDFEGEDSLACAKRELEEEIGMVASHYEFFSNIVTCIGVSDERVAIYFATGLSEGVKNPDPEEFIEILKVNLDTAVHMIFEGKIIDAKTIAAILAYQTKYNQPK